MQKKLLICVQCQNQFLLSAEEHERLVSKGFAMPKRCPDCRKKKSRIPDLDNEWGYKRRNHRSRDKRYFDE